MLWRWILPPAITLVLYWPGLVAWFQKDDFAWLGLHQMIHSWADLWDVLFHPYAQGTVRTLSERVFYTLFHALFGMHPLPYRMWAFLTHIANLTLIQLVCTRITGSPAAGFWAAMLWTLNANLAFALAWTAIYYELLCPCVFLIAMWWLIRYAESGERKYLHRLWITYLIGFGILELNVVFPALALVYVWCRVPHLWRKVVPMFIPAALYTIAHLMAAPLNTSGPYRMYWDASVLPTLFTYWKTALGPSRLVLLGIHPSFGRSLLTAALTVGLLGYLIQQLRRKNWIAGFGAAWFIAVLSPLLPLKDHISFDYLTVPTAGLAMWGASALIAGWQSGTAWRTVSGVLLAIFLCVNIPLARVNVDSFYERSKDIERLVNTVVAQAHANPGKPLVLTGLSPEMFWSAVWDRVFRLYGINEVYVAPESRPAIEALQRGPDMDKFFGHPPGAIVVDVTSGRP